MTRLCPAWIRFGATHVGRKAPNSARPLAFCKLDRSILKFIHINFRMSPFDARLLQLPQSCQGALAENHESVQSHSKDRQLERVGARDARPSAKQLHCGDSWTLDLKSRPRHFHLVCPQSPWSYCQKKRLLFSKLIAIGFRLL